MDVELGQDGQRRWTAEGWQRNHILALGRIPASPDKQPVHEEDEDPGTVFIFWLQERWVLHAQQAFDSCWKFAPGFEGGAVLRAEGADWVVQRSFEGEAAEQYGEELYNDDKPADSGAAEPAFREGHSYSAD